MNTLVIFGSSRSDGNTKKALDAVLNGRKIEIIDLLHQKISFYDYENKNQSDDFLNIAEKMRNADGIIFATPVYWYSMSAPMKIFFDRLTDLISIRKDIGRSLKGKTCHLVATGTDDILPLGFEEVFARTALYFDMQFGGSFYYHVQNNEGMSKEVKISAQDFGNAIFGS